MDGLIRLLRFRKTLSSITHYFFSLDFFDYYGGLRKKDEKRDKKYTKFRDDNSLSKNPRF